MPLPDDINSDDSNQQNDADPQNDTQQDNNNLAPDEKIADIDKNFVKDDTKTKLDIVNSGWYEGKTGNFCGAIVKIDKSNYDTEFVGVGYVTIKYNDNTEKTIFASVNEKGDNIRSASTVAKSVQQSEKYQNNYTKEQKEIVDAYAKGNSAN